MTPEEEGEEGGGEVPASGYGCLSARGRILSVCHFELGSVCIVSLCVCVFSFFFF